MTEIDPLGKYVLSTRIRTGRSIRGFRLPACLTFDERRDIERIVSTACLAIDIGTHKGTYFPLSGSRSYPLSPAMNTEKAAELRKEGSLFQEPSSPLLLSSGCGRHWPDARGIFHNDDKNFFVWVNEEDHMRIISMEKTADIRGVYQRFITGVSHLEY